MDGSEEPFGVALRENRVSSTARRAGEVVDGLLAVGEELLNQVVPDRIFLRIFGRVEAFEPFGVAGHSVAKNTAPNYDFP